MNKDSENQITHDTPCGGGFEKGSYLKTMGGPWWRTTHKIISVDSPSQMTLRWAWWAEPWYYEVQKIVIGLVYLWACYIWYDWS